MFIFLTETHAFQFLQFIFTMPKKSLCSYSTRWMFRGGGEFKPFSDIYGVCFKYKCIEFACTAIKVKLNQVVILFFFKCSNVKLWWISFSGAFVYWVYNPKPAQRVIEIMPILYRNILSIVNKSKTLTFFSLLIL